MTLLAAKPTGIVLMLGAEQFESHAQAFFAEGTGEHLSSCCSARVLHVRPDWRS